MIFSSELEFKYHAQDISLEDFHKFSKARTPLKYLFASGYDHFYKNTSQPDAFCRLRTGPDSNQLTFKRKTKETDNFVRTEHNIDLAPNVSRAQVEALAKEFGYLYEGTIFKNCFVYKYEFYILVFYICYNEGLEELGRFVEIEMSEEYPWDSRQEAWNSLVDMERLCRGLGITPQKRIKRSLFEMFGEKKV